MQLGSQVRNGRILKIDDAVTSQVATGQKNAGAEKLRGQEHTLAKSNNVSESVFVQVPYLNIEKEVPGLVQLLRCIYGVLVFEELSVV